MGKRRIISGALGALLVVLVAGHLVLGDVGAVFTGGAARLLCDAVFTAGRDPDLARQQDFDDRLTSPGKYLGLARTSVDREAHTVTASLWGWQTRKALHREGLGCTTADGVSLEDLRAQSPGVPWVTTTPDPSGLWPEGRATLADGLPDGIDGDRLRAAVAAGFTDEDPERPVGTRAVVVVHDGRIVAEQYADGFDADTAHLSNSVAKSVTATLVGILVRQGRLDVDAPAPIEEWRDPDDPRSAITLDHLMRMSSGLEFEEDYSSIRSDITMQYVGGDLAGYSVSKPLVAEPGERFAYSTGTSNILGRIVREAAGPDLATGLAFPRRELFEPLGMWTAQLEADSFGNFVGGSGFHASARDYARLGLLYLRDGVWDGRRILPEGWVDYVTTPTPGSGDEYPYGAQFWLNSNGTSDIRRHPEWPADAFFMNGHQGQHVVMIPSRDVVVVRTGLSEFDTWDVGQFVAGILDALPEAA